MRDQLVIITHVFNY